MSIAHRACVALLVGLGVAAALEHDAGASVLERVVAVVDDRPILLSELRRRAQPHLQRHRLATPDPSRGAALESEVLHEVLERMIDEHLVERAADRAHVTVTPAEIDRGIDEVAKRGRLTTSDVLAEAQRQGLTEQDYRDEIRRQLLEGKLVQLGATGRANVTEQDARVAYARWANEVAQSMVNLRIIVIGVPATASPAIVQAIEARAESVARQAQSGVDFCALVRQHSQNPTTIQNCGSYGAVLVDMLTPELARVSEKLAFGETASPVRFRDMTGAEAFLVVQRSPVPPSPPPYELVRDEMTARARVEVTERMRKVWRERLRRAAHVDVRL